MFTREELQEIAESGIRWPSSDIVGLARQCLLLMDAADAARELQRSIPLKEKNIHDCELIVALGRLDALAAKEGAG